MDSELDSISASLIIVTTSALKTLSTLQSAPSHVPFRSNPQREDNHSNVLCNLCSGIGDRFDAVFGHMSNRRSIWNVRDSYIHNTSFRDIESTAHDGYSLCQLVLNEINETKSALGKDPVVTTESPLHVFGNIKFIFFRYTTSHKPGDSD
jgi:hypothetical protein